MSRGIGRAMVTGAAGFIGSHTVEALINLGHEVVGVDSFTGYYPEAVKAENLSQLASNSLFELVRLDLVNAPLEPLLEDVDTVFHLAAQPGVRSSWASGFSTYVECNIMVTQRLLEAGRSFPGMRFVNASSSSVYGNAPKFPTSEADPTTPFSPYGVTKLAAEHLCSLYGANYGMSTVSLRYFSVYGPRQRPDMSMHRMIHAALTETAFPLLGDGTQIRDFTFVADVVQANLLAATADADPGSVYNIGGGSSHSMLEILDLVALAVGERVKVAQQAAVQGDSSRTGADITRAANDLGWHPRTVINDGIAAQVAWHRRRQ